MKPLAAALCLGVVALLYAGGGAARAGAIDVEALDALPRADVVVLGEVHDNPDHHRNQARVVAALAPAAVVWEMLTPAQVAQMPEARDNPDTVARALDWAGNGWPDFALYHPIVLAAGAARHFGAHVPRAEARAAFARGAAEVFGPQATRFGLQTPLPADEQQAREAAQFAAHCGAMPADMMPGMVAAQRLRDATLARAVLEALLQTGGPVAVIAGNGHARRDHGVPSVLGLAAPQVSVLSIGQLEDDPGDSAPFDLWLVTAPYPRPDPCATFQ